MIGGRYRMKLMQIKDCMDWNGIWVQFGLWIRFNMGFCSYEANFKQILLIFESFCFFEQISNISYWYSRASISRFMHLNTISLFSSFIQMRNGLFNLMVEYICNVYSVEGVNVIVDSGCCPYDFFLFHLLLEFTLAFKCYKLLEIYCCSSYNFIRNFQ